MRYEGGDFTGKKVRYELGRFYPKPIAVKHVKPIGVVHVKPNLDKRQTYSSNC